ncbi:helix-turn-helix domain-containing protein [Maritalea sp.]|uniref:helix-turn-helix domain-containing protein n=1 Tax=Maritalea sp. TaxID=2003361 RepID=UPI003EF84895
MRYDRAVAISKRHEDILVLVKSGTYSSDALAEKLNVSIPTIYRDVLFLKRQGYPIVSVKLSSKWAYQLGSNDMPDGMRVRRRLR